MINQATYDKYLSLGLSVIPIISGKKPAVEWKQYQTRKASVWEVGAWADKYPGIAMVCGKASGIVVVDVDDDREIESLVEAGVVVKSGFSGGHHYYFTIDSDIRKLGNRVRVEGLPVDFKTTGGYVILPPSEFDGGKYEFVKENWQGVGKLPEEIKSKLSVVNREKIELESGFPEVYEGERDNTIARVTGVLLKQVPPNLWDDLVLPALLNWNREKIHPSLSERDINRIYESICKSEWSKGGLELVTSVSPSLENLIIRQLIEKNDNLFQTEYPAFDEIIGGLQYNNLYAVAGLEKSGKSTWLMYMLQKKLEKGMRIGYVNTELTALEFAGRMAGYWLGKHPQTVIEDDIRNWTEEYASKFDYLGVESLKNVDTMMQKIDNWNNIEALIFDNATSLGNIMVKNKEGWQVMADAIQKLINVTKRKHIVTFVVLHTKQTTSSIGLTPAQMRSALKEQNLRLLFEESQTVVRRPSLADVYGGGTILSQLSGTILIWRPGQKLNDPQLSCQTRIVVESMRHAGNAYIEAKLDNLLGRFEEV